MKKFLKWLFPSYDNDLSVFLSTIVAITFIVLFTDLIPANNIIYIFLLFIPFMLGVAVIHKLLVKLFRRILGENNKHIGRGSVFALIIIYIVLNAIFD
ncbi:hypothetical protein VBD025_16760 [Virgibacillus flavescens]|uniref:hypothetical protein n=1 Tax=Virgibacillus flavescens TaxID=1611422 RepID=UPI003D32E296